MYVLYSLLILILGVVVSPYLAYQAIRYKKYIGSLGQRMGYLPVSFNLDGEESIWIHAVSVGETMTVRALIADLRRRYPNLRIFLSTTTMAGQQVARRNVHDVDAVFYLPLDLPFIVRRTLRLVKPRLFVMMETEIWPNLLRQCKRMGVATVLVNGRISSRSYPRYKIAKPFFRNVLADVDRFCMQTEEAARRVIDIGADPAKVVVTGSLKFDSLDVPGAAHARRAGAESRAAILPHDVRPSGRSSRAARCAKKNRSCCRRSGASRRAPPIRCSCSHRDTPNGSQKSRSSRATRRSSPRSASDLPIDAEPRADVVVLDTIGELAQVYQIATAVFVGGSLVDTGGHNILEPAVFGKPIVFGPHMHNFKEIAEAFVAQDAAIQVTGPRGLEEALLGLLTDPVRRARLGAAARALVESNRGAKDKCLAMIAQLLPLRGGTMGVVRPFRVVR